MSNLPAYIGANLYVEMEEILNATIPQKQSAPAPIESSSFNSKFDDIYNASQMEDEAFAIHDEDYTDFTYSTGYRTFMIVMTILIKLGLNLIVFVAEIYLAYAVITIIRKFKKSDIKSNVYILTLSLITIVSLSKSVLIGLLYIIFGFRGSIYFCLEEESQEWLFNLYIAFANLLGIDWWIDIYSSDNCKNIYNKYWKILVSCMHILNIILWITSISICHSSDLYFVDFYYLFVVISSILVTVFYVVRCFVKPKNITTNTDYKLYVCSVIVYSYLPTIIYTLLIELASYHKLFVYILLETFLIPEFFEVIHPLIVIYVLIRYNKYYKMSFDKISCKKSVTTEHEAFEEDDVEQQLNVSSDQINVL